MESRGGGQGVGRMEGRKSQEKGVKKTDGNGHLGIKKEEDRRRQTLGRIDVRKGKIERAGGGWKDGVRRRR